ncbi:MAG: Hint domain-containing protein, partial [Pseudomonadota bacterium]
MATFVLDVLDAANVSSNSSTVTISDNTFIQISVDDDDSNFDGDSLANEVGNDTNQFLTGTTDQVYLERVLDITDGVNTWTIADVESGGGNLGWAVVAGTEPLPTGSFTVTAIRNVTETSSPIDFSDVGIPCLTRGTLIDTTRGAVAVEELEAGDMVITRDAGPQPVRWVGSRTVDGAGRYAPVRIAAGALGNARDLLVSPNHRMVVEGR